MPILNFSHPLSNHAVSQLWGEEVINCPIQINLDEDVESQINEIINTLPVHLVNGMEPCQIILPGLAEAAVFLITILHGRTGSFPIILCLRRNDEGIFVFADDTPQFLQSVRDRAREMR